MRNRLMLAGLLVSLLSILLNSCSGGNGGGSTRALELGEVEAASPEQTAAWLQDPATVDRGVWSMLENLGIGVYTQEAQQLLPGSERSAEDFFLFDFEVDLLTSGGQREQRPFTDYYQMLTQFGLQLSEDELKSFYHSTYAAQPELWLAQLFHSMGLEFEGDVQLTPLQEWLLFLDTFVPPNNLQVGGAAGNGLMAPAPAPLRDGPCDAVRGDNADVGWGAAWQAAGFTSDAIEGSLLGPMSFIDPKDLLHAIMMYMGVETRIHASSSVAHEGHEGEGDAVTFTVSVEFTGDLPEEITSCATVMGFDVPPKGPLEGVRVEWELDDVLAQHGYTTRGGGVMFTDAAGKSEVVWSARHEPSGGEGEEYEQPGTMEAVVRIQSGDVFNLFAGLQEFIMPRTETSTIAMGWHESSWILNMSLDTELGESFINFSWDGQFIVDEDYSLDGEGKLTITGSTGTCKVYENDNLVHEGPPGNIDGSFPFEIGGEQVLKAYAQVFDFEISSDSVAATIKPRDERCGMVYDLAETLISMIGSDIQDMVPMGLIEIEAKSGKSTEINVPEIGKLNVTVISSGG